MNARFTYPSLHLGRDVIIFIYKKKGGQNWPVLPLK